MTSFCGIYWILKILLNWIELILWIGFNILEMSLSTLWQDSLRTQSHIHVDVKSTGMLTALFPEPRWPFWWMGFGYPVASPSPHTWGVYGHPVLSSRGWCLPLCGLCPWKSWPPRQPHFIFRLFSRKYLIRFQCCTHYDSLPCGWKIWNWVFWWHTTGG